MERVWPSRLRWRMRGAWQWPTFALLVVVDAVLLALLPVAGEGDGPHPVEALLLSGFLNLVAVAVLGPLVGLVLRRRRRDLPTVVASDYGGTTVLVALCGLVLGLGLAHRPAREERRDALAAGLARVRAYVERSAPPEFRRHLDEATNLQLADGLSRTCVPGDDPQRALCLLVQTDPPGITVDPNRAPNSSYAPTGGG